MVGKRKHSVALFLPGPPNCSLQGSPVLTGERKNAGTCDSTLAEWLRHVVRELAEQSNWVTILQKSGGEGQLVLPDCAITDMRQCNMHVCTA